MEFEAHEKNTMLDRNTNQHLWMSDRVTTTVSRSSEENNSGLGSLSIKLDYDN